MDVATLLDAAKRAKGSLGAVADALGTHQTTLSKWRSGDRHPDADELAILADMAGLPVLETVAEVQKSMTKTAAAAAIWEQALGKLRAAGVAATVTLTLLISSMMMLPTDAEAAGGNGGIRTLDEALHPILP